MKEWPHVQDPRLLLEAGICPHCFEPLRMHEEIERDLFGLLTSIVSFTCAGTRPHHYRGTGGPDPAPIWEDGNE